MLCRVALVRTDVAEEPSASVIKVTKICEIGTKLVAASVVPSSPILVTLMKEALDSSATSVLTRATRRNIREDTILHEEQNFILSSELHNLAVLISYAHLSTSRAKSLV
jgi:hypothetical protein